MVLDKNKSALTHQVTAAATAWLEGHGFKPVESEVSVAPGWCADLAALIFPTMTELIALKLLKRRPNSWKRVNGKYVRISGGVEKLADWKQQLNMLYSINTALVEVKTSRADFFRDWKKKFAAQASPVSLRYLAVPEGLIKPGEYPEGWGILIYHPTHNKCVQVTIPAALDIENNLQNFNVAAQIAIRRDHHTRYERWREYQRAARVADGEKQVYYRIDKLARMMVALVNGKFDTLEVTLSYYGIKIDKLTGPTIESLQRIHETAKDKKNEQGTV